MREEVVEYVMEEFQTTLLQELDSISGKMDRKHSRRRELEGELANLTQALASGQLSPSIMAAIADREREIATITDNIVSSSEDSIKSRIGDMRAVAKSKLKDLQALLRGDVTVARAALLKHISQIEMEPHGKGYIAKGDWSLLGVRPTSGAGGAACTMLPQAYFRVEMAA